MEQHRKLNDLTNALGTLLASVGGDGLPREITRAARAVTAPDGGEGPVVIADRARLQQVLFNLLSNAGKFTPNGGHVDVRVTEQDGDVDIQVIDNGEGIPAAFLPHLFERFRQADGSATCVNGGLGIGLAVARHIVEMHGGTINAGSEGVGCGASFSVRLPRAPRAADARSI